MRLSIESEVQPSGVQSPESPAPMATAASRSEEQVRKEGLGLDSWPVLLSDAWPGLHAIEDRES